MQQDPEALDLQQALGILLRRMPLILLCVVVVAGAAYGYSRHQPKKYVATASLVFSNGQLSQQVAGLPASSANAVAQHASDLELVRLGDMAAKTAGLLGHGLTEQKVAASLSIVAQGESSVVDVSATAALPAMAASIANTYTHQFVTEQNTATKQYFESALALVRRQLAKLAPAQRAGQDGVQLQNRAQTLGLLAELGYGNVQIAQEALQPTAPSSPKTSRNTGLGVLLGLLIGLGLAFILERLDRRVRRPEELEAIYCRPMLGVVPKSRAFSQSTPSNGGIRASLPAAEAEAFNLICARLRSFNLDHDLRTILIASSAPGEGNTTIARLLAEAATRLGSRTLLLEMDLRNPTLASQLGIQPGPGVFDVLTGAISMSEAIQRIDLGSPPGAGTARSLDALAAGTVLPSNPAELFESHSTDAMLEHAKATYDLVVIDAPPLTVVSDAFPLLTKVDGVVAVGWVGRSRQDAVEQLHHVLTTSGVPLLGIIANGSTSSRSSAYTASYKRSDDKPLATAAVASANGKMSSDELVPTAGSS